jgi:DNA-binding CsgD family transcriptional regulator
MPHPNKNRISELTDREIQVLKLIAEGKTNAKIAVELGLSPLTVKTHRQNLLHKMSASNTAQLVANSGLLF